VSQTCRGVFQPFWLMHAAGLLQARVLRAKRDHIAVGERVFMVFDATIRPLGHVGLQPGAGMKRFTPRGQSTSKMHGVMHARRAVVWAWALDTGGWASRTGGQRSKSRVRAGSNASYLLCVARASRDSRIHNNNSCNCSASAYPRVCLGCMLSERSPFRNKVIDS
jgi:hypothetical protein